MMDSVTALPRYPAIMLSAGVGGSIEATMDLDSTGRVVMRSYRLTRATHQIFDMSLRSALPQFRFKPGQPGTAMPTSLALEVVYANGGGDSLPSAPVFRQEDTPRGLRITLGRELMPRTEPSPRFSGGTIRDIQIAAIRGLMPKMPVDSGVAWCLSIVRPGTRRPEDYDPPRELLSLAPSGFVPISRCPHTWISMMGLRDEQGRQVEARPLGVRDPAALVIQGITPWSETAALVRLEIREGSGGRIFVCYVTRPDARSREWMLKCSNLERFWVS
jgi:hypothetical protein